MREIEFRAVPQHPKRQIERVMHSPREMEREPDGVECADHLAVETMRLRYRVRVRRAYGRDRRIRNLDVCRFEQNQAPRLFDHSKERSAR